MSAIMKIRQARDPDQIADALEPLAVSLATLADQAQDSIKGMEAAAAQQAREWSSQQASAAGEVAAAAKSVAQQAKALQQATASLQRTVQQAQQAQRGQLWTLVTVAGAAAILASMLMSGFWLWLELAAVR